MAQFPTDIVADILSRLAVEPILRFRCVSKPWCALIDSSHFIKLHLKRSTDTKTNRQIILSSSEIYSVNMQSLDVAVKIDHHPFLEKPGGFVEVVGSCDGLLLIRKKIDDGVSVWNPFTRIHQILPSITDIQTPDNCRGIAKYYGIGYDSVHHDYKVLYIIQFCVKDVYTIICSDVRVYSLKTNSWKMIVTDFPCCLSLAKSQGVFAAGSLHWIANDNYANDCSIIAFDLATEEYRIVPISPSLLGHEESSNFHMELTSLEGFLCIVSKYEDDPCNVWMIKDYGVKESWTKLFSLPPYGYPESYGFVTPVAFSKDGTEILLLQDNKELVFYDLELKLVQKVNIRGSPAMYAYDVDLCVQSLVPLNMLVESNGWELHREENKKHGSDKGHALGGASDIESKAVKIIGKRLFCLCFREQL